MFTPQMYEYVRHRTQFPDFLFSSWKKSYLSNNKEHATIVYLSGYFDAQPETTPIDFLSQPTVEHRNVW